MTLDNYGLVNIRFGFQNARFEVFGYVENLLDKDYVSSAFMIISQIIGVRLYRGNPRSLIIIGSSFLLLSMIGVTCATSSMMLIVALFLMGLGLGLILPANLAYLSFIASENAQGKMAGINAVAQGLGVAAGAFFGAILYRTSVILPSSGGILISLLVLTLVFVQQRGKPL